MAPTDHASPAGREASLAGYPIQITEMLALLPGVAYAARGSVAGSPYAELDAPGRMTADPSIL